MTKTMHKKGMELGDLMPIALAFIVVTIAISVGANVLSTTRDELSATGTYNGSAASLEENVTTNGLSGMDTLASWLPTIALVIAAAIVIGVLVRHLARA